MPLGVLMFGIGAGLLWWSLQKAKSGAAAPSGTSPASEWAPRAVASTPVALAARQEAWGPEVFAAIEWRRFEAVVETLFQQAGLEAKSQPHGADGGVDVWLYSRTQPDQPVSLVQCKHWSGKQVGVDKVRELLGVMASKRVPRGIFATTSTFSSDAREFAQGNGIDLLDVHKLLTIITKRTPEQQQALLEIALEGEYWRPTCVNCGIKLVERTSGKDGGKFWGCANFPRCRVTLPMRAILQ
jgi:restriction system protein